MPKRMMVFDHRHCRWIPWHGTRAAWLKLPHAAGTGVCLLGAAMLQAAAPLPAVPARPVPAHVAPALALLSVLATAVVPPGLGFTEATPTAASAGGTAPNFQPTIWPATDGYRAPAAGFLTIAGFPPIETNPFDGTDPGQPLTVPPVWGDPPQVIRHVLVDLPPTDPPAMGPKLPAPEPGSATLLIAALGLLTAFRGRSRLHRRTSPGATVAAESGAAGVRLSIQPADREPCVLAECG